MESRLPELFRLICLKQESFTIDKLSELFNVTSKTILADLAKLNDFLSKAGFNEILVRNKKVTYPESINASFLNILPNKKDILYLDSNFRKRQITLDVLLNTKNLSILNLMAKYSLSKNTIIKEIREVKKALSSQGIKLQSIPFTGYVLVGDEETIRKLIASLYPTAQINIFDQLENIEQIEKTISIIFKTLKRHVSQNSFDRIISYFWASYERTNQGFFIENNLAVPDKHYLEIETMTENESFNKLFPNCVKRPAEMNYLGNLIAEASLADINENVADDWLFWNFITIDFIKHVGIFFAEPFFDQDEKLFQGILTHLRPAYNRIRSQEELNNPLYEQIVTKFQNLNSAVTKAIPQLELKLDVKFSKQEISFLTLFFAASLERKHVKVRKLKKVIVVCNSGLSTSQLLNSKLQGIFKFNFLGTFSKREADNWLRRNEVDLIISTIDFSSEKAPTIKVNPMLPTQDVDRIQKISRIPLHEINIDEIISIFTRHVRLSEQQKRLVYVDLKHLLQNNLKKDGYEPMLTEVLTPNTIKTKYLAKDWQDAVKECGNLLVKDGDATNNYVTAMIQNVKTNGNYIVIAPGIAMPHARPEKGALKIGFSLVTLQTPINFGHPTNDPVKLVIGLCATDNQSHLLALSELVELLGNLKVVEQINRCQTSEEIYKIIREGNKK
ncbi:BglG family transcription antiterminator [Xylocopilactobacillus apicola]|uniref:Sugar transporter n=1 Tax=Xylocopilactobacillus apicola TaxID=2932184 RepID=A0AAU9D092_9LACO|nr:PTS sugar transporter subunit IIA [Xylocopilactobacillus apicola]BDR59692.1 sugar transporter [Xylocopilactobacillus apicola]